MRDHTLLPIGLPAGQAHSVPRGAPDRMRNARVVPRPSWLEYVSLPALLWVMLWFSINTGPWMLQRTPVGLLQWLHAVRALFPLIVLVLAAGYVLLGNRAHKSVALPNPLKLWLIYGFIGAGAGAMSPKPLDAVWWAVAYIATIALLAAYLRAGDPVGRAVQANYLSWAITCAFLLTMVVLAREALFADPHSGYGIIGRQPRVLDMPMSRSSGLARFAAVPGIIGFVFLLRGTSRWKQLFWGAVFVLSAAFLYYLQSRGAMVGFAFALVCAMLLLGTRGRVLLMVLLVLLGVALLAETIPPTVGEHLTRGTTLDRLTTLGGRTKFWRMGWPEIWKSPIVGWGFQADRFLPGVRSHIHNTYLYALLTSGALGATAFTVGLVWVWVQLLGAVRSGVARRLHQEVFLAQVGGILAFFTVRGIVEVSGALFAIDLMVMLPAMAYIGVLAAISAKAQRFPATRGAKWTDA